MYVKRDLGGSWRTAAHPGRNCGSHNRLAITESMVRDGAPTEPARGTPPLHSHRREEWFRNPAPESLAIVASRPRKSWEGKSGDSELCQQRYYRVVIRDAGIRTQTNALTVRVSSLCVYNRLIRGFANSRYNMIQWGSFC